MGLGPITTARCRYVAGRNPSRRPPSPYVTLTRIDRNRHRRRQRQLGILFHRRFRAARLAQGGISRWMVGCLRLRPAGDAIRRVKQKKRAGCVIRAAHHHNKPYNHFGLRVLAWQQAMSRPPEIQGARMRMHKGKRNVTIQVSCKIFCHEGLKFHKDTKKTLYFLLRAFVPSCLRGFLLL